MAGYVDIQSGVTVFKKPNETPKAESNFWSSTAHNLEVIIFGSRWLLTPLYLGLIVALLVVTVKFLQSTFKMVSHIGSNSIHTFTLDLLGMLDLVLLANLILIVLFAGYENFVSKIEIAESSVDRPKWMGNVDFSSLKIKLIGSLVAISLIELLKDFIELADVSKIDEGVIWRVIIHLTFVVSGVLFAVMDKISYSRTNI